MGKSFRLIGVDNLDYGNAKQLNTIISNIGKAGVGEYIEFWAMSSLDASTMFPDGYLNHVFIDSSHKFEQTKTEARCWYRKLVHEGVLSGHDYFSEENPEVRQAVDEVVPADRLFTQETTHGSGIWGIRKNDNCPLI